MSTKGESKTPNEETNQEEEKIKTQLSNAVAENNTALIRTLIKQVNNYDQSTFTLGYDFLFFLN